MAVAVGVVAPSAAEPVNIPTSPYLLSIIAGDNQSTGTPTDGAARQSQLNDPTDMAFDPDGNLYVADTGNCVIVKITPAYQLSVFAGLSFGCNTLPRNGVGNGRLVSLAWLNGHLYVGSADTGYIYRADANGNLTPVAGTGVEGPPSLGQVDTPTQMVAHGSYLYFGDQASHEVARFNPDANPVTIEVIAGDGSATSTPSTPLQDAKTIGIAMPNGVAVAPNGTVYVSDTQESRILQISSTGELLGQVFYPGPVGLALDTTGETLYTASYAGVITMMSTDFSVGGIGNGALIAGMGLGASSLAEFSAGSVDQVSAQIYNPVVEGPSLETPVGQPAGVELDAKGDIYATLSGPSMLVKLTKIKPPAPPVPPFTGPDTPVVTAAPSAGPSATPSISPSAVPTSVPPSVVPTAVPSVVPTTPGPVVTSPAPDPSNPPKINLNLQLAVDAPLEGAKATVSGGGLQPASPYTLTMYSTPIEVARGTTNAAGAFNAVITMPAKACVKGGSHRLVLTGTAPGGAKLEDSSYVVLDDTCKAKSINNVTAPVNNTVTLQSFTFPHLSAKLRPKAQRTLRDLRGALTSAKAITITGYTETDSRGKAATKANRKLALKRANAVRAHLRKLGITVPVTTAGAGGVNGLGKGQKFNRRVVIVVRY
ncbi:outer membrane protein OmpA-like peptidoglycan-associated protein [Catenuloplanes nepalensis]|uniref:Outer membrane protein OmpA-like peptidoglycan-associated protein n=1 Tax=Catenuloplanes nepalensis TaxID=587533 RepID=A0ABT9MPY3_9ACTN|nr:OmpA family protein [Catenuloplanes nepalensis]MDP9793494.1 outer membrane protein OmpA-like peptidoglycan-associated protein [Catenuloplanes nepalensis]